MAELIRCEKLKKFFSTPKGMLHAVDGVSFNLFEGETLGVVGESGCGKSTLGRVVIHLSDSTGGNIYYKDRDITRVDKKQLRELRKDMQMIFQDPYSSVNPRMTVSQTIAEPLIIAGEMRRGDREKRVDQLMEIVGLAPRREASKGEHCPCACAESAFYSM